MGFQTALKEEVIEFDYITDWMLGDWDQFRAVCRMPLSIKHCTQLLRSGRLLTVGTAEPDGVPSGKRRDHDLLQTSLSGFTLHSV